MSTCSIAIRALFLAFRSFSICVLDIISVGSSSLFELVLVGSVDIFCNWGASLSSAKLAPVLTVVDVVDNESMYCGIGAIGQYNMKLQNVGCMIRTSR